MNAKLLTLIASTAAMSMASAFTIDFNTLTLSDGTTPSGFTINTIDSNSPQTVTVPGYGDVLFQVASGSSDSISVGSTFTNDAGTIQQSLELGSFETIVVTFLGADVLDVDFDIIGVSTGQNAAPSVDALDRNQFQYSPNTPAPGGTEGAGIAAISFTAVPEPSSSLLIVIGAGSMLLRRRR